MRTVLPLFPFRTFSMDGTDLITDDDIKRLAPETFFNVRPHCPSLVCFMAEPMNVRVKKWLQTAIDNSKMAVDHGWSVEPDPKNDKFMVIDSKQMPFKIIVSLEEDITYIAFVTGLNLHDQAPEVLVPIMTDLLVQNNSMKLSKFCLMGKEQTLCLRTDLYTNYMNKKEFNMALESVIMGGRWLLAQLGQSEDESIRVKEMTSLGSAELVKGTSKEEVVAKMVKVGFPEDKAKELVTRLAISLGLEQPPKPDDKAKAAVAKGGKAGKPENPVDNYIW